jgi:predicted dehydrogenase
MGFVGMGIQNRGLLNQFLHSDTLVLAVCDVDTTRREHARNTVDSFYQQASSPSPGPCATYIDWQELIARDDIDAVSIATPDHWHAIVTLGALQSGKDVYCEKPLTHNIQEAIDVIRTVDAEKRVLQTGSMQRSMKEFRVAAELVRNGAIGAVQGIECSFGDPPIPCDLPEEDLEPGLEWDRWVGPAPIRPYSSVLSPRGIHNHFPDWRNYREFGGGMVCDWGAHHLDIAQWALGMDDSGPVKAVPPPQQGDKRGASLVYANGITVTHRNGFGVTIRGAEGEVLVNRGRFSFSRNGEQIAQWTRREDGGSLDSTLIKAEQAFLTDAKVKLYRSQNHVQDFLDAVRKRSKPITHEGVGGRTAICCHLMNLAYEHHVPVEWQPEPMAFANNSGNPAWLTRHYRAPYLIPTA